MKAQVMVYSATGKVPLLLRPALDARLTVHVVTSMEHWPATCDYYCTAAALSTRVERAAATVHALPVVLPEGNEYLAARVWTRALAGQITWLFLATHVGEPAYVPYRGRKATKH